MNVRNLLSTLFDDQNVPDVDDDLANILERTELERGLVTKAGPLADILKSIGCEVKSSELVPDYGSIVWLLPCQKTYSDALELFKRADGYEKLAQAGWVATSSGMLANAEEPTYRIRFIKATKDNFDEPGDEDKSAEDVEKLMKDANDYFSVDPDNPKKVDAKVSDALHAAANQLIDSLLG